jgi:regulator of cell morphogenesis and NO signaling
MPTDLSATSLSTLVTETPSATRVLLRHGLDFCCGGKQTLAEACSRAGLSLEGVLSELAALAPDHGERRWDVAPIPELIQHILDVYHAPLEEDLTQLKAMADKVLRVHGDKDPERLTQLRATVYGLADELLPHMMKEEQVLFPWILSGRQPRPEAPISVMKHEHVVAGELLERAKQLTDTFTPPAEACHTWRNLYARLEEFDSELRQHIHLENNVLFPRVLGS